MNFNQTEKNHPWVLKGQHLWRLTSVTDHDVYHVTLDFLDQSDAVFRANVMHSYVFNMHNNALACWIWMCRPSQHCQVSFKLIFCVLWANRSGSLPLGSITSVTACIGPDCTAFLLEHSVLCWHLSTVLVSFQYYLFYINYYLSLICINGQHGGSFEWGHSVAWMWFCGTEPFAYLAYWFFKIICLCLALFSQLK